MHKLLHQMMEVAQRKQRKEKVFGIKYKTFCYQQGKNKLTLNHNEIFTIINYTIY